jgi:probable phosphoglycerate mutase
VSETLRPVAFWYLRHGETDWNAQNLAQGNVDTHLNERGLQQAREAAVLLQGRGIVSLVASPFRRAQQTAHIVAEALGLPIETEEELHEVSFGSMEGRPMLADWFNDWVAEKSTPEGAETFVELRLRAVGAVNRALARPAPVLVVAHGALFRALRSAMGLAPNVRLANASATWCEPPAVAGEPWVLTAAT